MRRALLLCLPLLAVACNNGPEATGPACEATAEEPVGLLLTWQSDPTTTMTIDWHTLPGDTARPTLCFKVDGAEAWQDEVQATQLEYPFSERTIQRVELTGLQPATTYRFQAGEFGRSFAFRTMPADLDEAPLTFAIGGDTMGFPGMMDQVNEVVLAQDPAFAVFAGDLAYADGGAKSMHKTLWEAWFEAYKSGLVAEDGRAVPVVVGIGNHEVREGYVHNHDDYEQTDDFRASIAPYFYGLFAFPGQPGYAALDFGDYLTLVALDTDHTNPVVGEQTDWLASVLAERQDRGVPHVFPFYHVPAYPSHRAFDGSGHARVRDHWVPLFEAHGVRLAFEAHDHTYKRTHPILGGEVHEDGIVFLGDGAWGVPTRSGDNKDAWFIDQFSSSRHAILVTLQGTERQVRVLDHQGELIDEASGL